MPLLRYEVRCEHSLANPELYRSAAQDDPEELMEGVAMAGLVGIVRQLGDLAEFAAEIFWDLHNELMAIGGRGYDLTARLQQLEVELPFVEKTLLSEPNQIRFAYCAGSNWHASIQSDRNHCTQGELPRFIRNFYEECRGPPRLFLLDKFDGAGEAGACLKRYTDSSFFKLEWAKSELIKAQHVQCDKKANLEKKKGRHHIKAQHKGSNQTHSRVHYPFVRAEGFDRIPQNLASSLKVENTIMSHLPVSSGAGIQRWKSWHAPRAVNSAEESSASLLKPKGAVINGGEIAAREVLPNPIKLSGTDNGEFYDKASKIKEEEVKNGEGKASDVNEIRNGHEGLSASNASILVEMQDHQAARQDSRPMSTEHTESTTGTDHIPVAGLRGDMEAAGMGSKPSRHKMKEDVEATHVACNISQKNSMKESEPVQILEELSRHSLKDDAEAAHISAEDLKHAPVDVNNGGLCRSLKHISLEICDVANRGGRFSQQRSVKDGDNFSDARTPMGCDKSPVKAHVQGLPFNGEILEAAETHTGLGLNHSTPEGCVESLKRVPIQTSNPVEKLNSLPPFDTLNLSHLEANVAEEPLHERIGPFHDNPPVSGTMSEGPSSSSVSSAESERPMVEHDKCWYFHQEGINEAGNLELIPGGDGSMHDVPHVLKVPEECEVPKVSSMHIEEVFDATTDEVDESEMATSPTISSPGSSSSATIPTMCTTGRPILEPSVSNLSRFSYSSSSLISVSSYSAPSSPSTPNSSVLNIASPPRSTGSTDSPRGNFPESPPLKGSSKSRSDPNSQSPAKNPKLSLPLMSPLPSLQLASLEQEDTSSDDSRLSYVTTPSLHPFFLHTSSSTLVCSSSMPKLYPLPSPPGFLEPGISHSLVNSPPGHGLSPICTETFQSEDKPPSDARIELQTNLSAKSIPLSLSQITMPTPATSESMGSNSILPPCPATGESMGSNSILPPCPAASPKSSAPSSPLANPQPSAPGPLPLRCEFTVLSIPPIISGLPSQSSPPGSSRWNAVQSSAPTSPTGSVIIKDSPSPQGSPESNYGQSPKSVPGLDTPLCSQFYSRISSSAEFDLDARTTLPGNLDHDNGNYTEQITLLEPQERALGSLDLNAQKSQTSSPDLDEGETQPWFDHKTVKIPVHSGQFTAPSGSPSGSALDPWMSMEEDNCPTESLDLRSPPCSSPVLEINSQIGRLELPSQSETPSSAIVEENFPLESAVSHGPAGPDIKFLSNRPASLDSEILQSSLVQQDTHQMSSSSEELLSDLMSSIPVGEETNMLVASSRTGLSPPIEESTSGFLPPTLPDPERLPKLREQLPHMSPSTQFSEATLPSESNNPAETIDLELNLSTDSQLSEQYYTPESNQAVDSLEPATMMHQKELVHQQTPPSAGGYALRKTSETRSALAAALAAPENMLTKVSFREAVIQPRPHPSKQQSILEQIRTKSFNLRRTEKQKKEPVDQSVTNTNVAAILEKANAIKQALARHDEEYGKEDEWSDA